MSTTLARRLGAGIDVVTAGDEVRDRLAQVVAQVLSAALLAAGRADVTAGRRALLSGSGPSTVIGHRDGAAPALAALANALPVAAEQRQDGHRRARGHPGAHVVPAVLAVAEAEESTGRETCSALLAGYEVGAALGVVQGGTPVRCARPRHLGSAGRGGRGWPTCSATATRKWWRLQWSWLRRCRWWAPPTWSSVAPAGSICCSASARSWGWCGVRPPRRGCARYRGRWRRTSRGAARGLGPDQDRPAGRVGDPGGVFEAASHLRAPARQSTTRSRTWSPRARWRRPPSRTCR